MMEWVIFNLRNGNFVNLGRKGVQKGTYVAVSGVGVGRNLPRWKG